MTNLLIAWLFAGLPYPTLLEFDDSNSFADEAFMQSPTDVIFIKGTLFIADELGHQVIRVQGDKIERIAAKGKGPGELANRPVDLDWRNNALHVYEWNHHVVSRFSLNGKYLNRLKPERLVIRLTNLQIKLRTLEERYRDGNRYTHPNNDCSFGQFEEKTILGEHINRSILTQGEDGQLLLATRQGRFREISSNCEESDLFQLSLSKFAKPPTRTTDRFVAYQGKLVNLYQHGLPLIGFAAQSKSKAWALVSNEHTEERFLYEMDLENGEQYFALPLDYAFSGIRYHRNSLILWSADDAIVRVYDISEE